jgi:hypothetical protein
MTIYEKLLAAGCEIEKGPGTDLYALATTEALAIIKEGNAQYLYFTSEGTRWVEVPFAWDPAWLDPYGYKAARVARCMATVEGGAT